MNAILYNVSIGTAPGIGIKPRLNESSAARLDCEGGRGFWYVMTMAVFPAPWGQVSGDSAGH